MTPRHRSAGPLRPSRLSSAVLLGLLAALAAGRAEARQVVATLEDSFPFAASRAVDSDPEAAGLIAAGFGSGLFRLQGGPELGQLWFQPAGPTHRDAGGLVADVHVSPFYTYVAASRAGLNIYTRPPGSGEEQVPGTDGASAVTMVQLAATRGIVVVGTQEPGGSGRLLLVDHAPYGTQVIWQTDVGSPVHAVAASKLLAPPGANFTVFLGTACGELNGAPAGLQRRDFVVAIPPAGPAVAAEVDRSGWARDGLPTLVRDVVLDEGHGRAYAAAYWDGVYAFDVGAPGLLAQDTSPGWPIKLGSTNPAVPVILGYANALALDPAPGPGAGARLVVGMGDRLAGESQFSGDCSKDLPCNAAYLPPEAQGDPSASPIHVGGWGVGSYRLDETCDPYLDPDTGQAAVEASIAEYADPYDPLGTLEAMPLDLAVRRPGPFTFFVDAALDAGGMQVFRATDLIWFGWVMIHEAGWDHQPGVEVPLTTSDDALVLQHPGGVATLHVSTEQGLMTFDLADPAPLTAAEPLPAWEPGGAIMLTGFPNPGGRVYASTSRGRVESPGGLRVFRLDGGGGALAPEAVPHELHKHGFGFGVEAAVGLFDQASLPGPLEAPRYLYSVQLLDTPSACGPQQTGSVRLWDVGTAALPRDPSTTLGSPGPGDPLLLDVYEQGVTAPGEPCLALESLAVLPVSSGGGGPGEHAVYVAYRPSPGGPQEAGILVLRTALGDDGVAGLSLQTRHATWTAADGPFVNESFRPGWMTLDPETGRLYAAWACGGIAMYDVATDPFAPALIARRAFDPSAAGGLGRTPLQVLPGPRVGPEEWVYISFLNRGVGLLDATNARSFERARILPAPMRFQTAGMALDPFAPDRDVLYVTQTRAGVDRVSFVIQ